MLFSGDETSSPSSFCSNAYNNTMKHIHIFPPNRHIINFWAFWLMVRRSYAKYNSCQISKMDTSHITFLSVIRVFLIWRGLINHM